jgi:hypothetical protein
LLRRKTHIWRLAGGDVIELELSKMGDQDRLSKVLDLYSSRSSRLTVNERVKAPSRGPQRLGLRLFDSLHLAQYLQPGRPVDRGRRFYKNCGQI